MPILRNPKHEKFAEELAKGKNATEAYVIAGYKENRACASRLLTNENIRARISELVSIGAEKAECTVASLIMELEEARNLAQRIEQPAAMVSASMGKAKLSRLISDRVEHTGKNGGPIEHAEVDPARDIVNSRIASLAARFRADGNSEKPH